MSGSKRSLEDAPLNNFHRRLAVYSAGGPFLDGYVLSTIGVVVRQIRTLLQLSVFWEGLIAASAFFLAVSSGACGSLSATLADLITAREAVCFRCVSEVIWPLCVC